MRRMAALSALLLLVACKQELPKNVDQKPDFGPIEAIELQKSVNCLLYRPGEDPHSKNWGSMTVDVVRVHDTAYYVEWVDKDKVASYHVGDKLNVHPGEYIICLGQNDLKPDCRRMVRVFRNARPIAPLGHG